jgi:hypothetical protein
LAELITPITSTSLQWITFLTISGPTDHLRSGLINLTKLVNLGALDIHNGNPTGSANPAVTDSLVRAWGRAALADGAFPILKVLMLRNHDCITAQTLEYISDFPRLAIFNGNDCNIRRKDAHQATKTGRSWKLIPKNSGLLHRFGEIEEGGVANRRWHFPISAAYEYATLARGKDRPTLNFRLGGSSEDDSYFPCKTPLIFHRDEGIIQSEPTQPLVAVATKRPSHGGPPPPKQKRSKLRDSRQVDVRNMLKEFGT